MTKAIGIPAAGAMRTRRPLAINNSLCHGICNYNCRLCGVNKPGYRGPREFQPREVTETLVRRVLEAAEAGIWVRYIANAGDGEPTLHPGFAARMDAFGEMLRGWSAAASVPPPEVSVVTNGSRLLAPGVLEAVELNRLTLIVSFPTPDADHYGRIMAGRAELGTSLMERVVPGLEAAMAAAAAGRLARLCFHVSPPEREIIRADFPDTLEFLTARAARAGLEEIALVMFPATSNRSGLVRSRARGTDSYRDLFARYHGRSVNGVRVRMTPVQKRFFANAGEVLDLLRCFRFPCIWNANLFIAAGGESTCCNDQAVRRPLGNVLTSSIAELMAAKEQAGPGVTCAACNQRPETMRGSAAARIFSVAARMRIALGRRSAGAARA
jgi:hypothetical protein